MTYSHRGSRSRASYSRKKSIDRTNNDHKYGKYGNNNNNNNTSHKGPGDLEDEGRRSKSPKILKEEEKEDEPTENDTLSRRLRRPRVSSSKSYFASDNDDNDLPPIEDGEYKEVNADENEEEEATRCICENEELQDPDESKFSSDVDIGLFIQCDKCGVWQHGYCVGILEDVPDQYWCEQCKPELHIITVKPGGKTSQYIPAQRKSSPQKHVSSRRASRQNGTSGSKSDSSPPHEARKTKRRSTLNSSANQETFERVLQESALESNSQVNGSDSEGTETSSSPKRSSRQLKKKLSTIKEREQSAQIDEKNDLELVGKSGNNKNNNPLNSPDSFFVTPNKRVSRVDNSASTPGSRKRRKGNTHLDKSLGSESDKVEEPLELHPNNELSSMELTSDSTEVKSRKRNKRHKRSSSATTNSSVSTRSQNGTPMSRSSKIDKPAKPRLPPTRVTMTDMKKRVAAILEFIGRTQVELATEQRERRDFTEKALFKGHELADSKDKDLTMEHQSEIDHVFDSLFDKYKGSLTLMDSLTRKLLVWEQNFGKYGDKE